MSNIVREYATRTAPITQLTSERGNWDLYINSRGELFSFATCEATKQGCKDSFFSNDISYLVSTIYKYKGFKLEDFTAQGKQLLADYIAKRGYTLAQLFNSNYNMYN